VILTLKKTNKIYEKISEETINKGLASRQMCRNQMLPDEIIAKLPFEKKPKYIILDVGHNPDAIVIF